MKLFLICRCCKIKFYFKVVKRYNQQQEKIANLVNQIENTQSNKQSNWQKKDKFSRRIKFFFVCTFLGVSFWGFTKYLENELDLAVSFNFNYFCSKFKKNEKLKRVTNF